MDRLDRYIEAHCTPQEEGLEWIRKQTNLRTNRARMMSGPAQGGFLKMLVRMTGAKKVLELGTFTGYSAACIALGFDGDNSKRLDTLEINDEMTGLIREGWIRCGVEELIKLHTGDALDTLQSFSEEEGCCHKEYDMAYIDANKREYRAYFAAVLPLVRKGGVIIADNTLWDCKILEDPMPCDAQTREIAAFNDMIAACTDVEAVMLPVRDGLTMIRKK